MTEQEFFDTAVAHLRAAVSGPDDGPPVDVLGRPDATAYPHGWDVTATFGEIYPERGGSVVGISLCVERLSRRISVSVQLHGGRMPPSVTHRLADALSRASASAQYLEALLKEVTIEPLP